MTGPKEAKPSSATKWKEDKPKETIKKLKVTKKNRNKKARK